MKKIYWKVLLITTIILIFGFLFLGYKIQHDIQKYYFNNRQDTPKIIGDGFAPCLSVGGKWSAEFKECLGIDAATCENIGGKFNECASACRNDLKAEICTMQCVQVCDVK